MNQLIFAPMINSIILLIMLNIILPANISSGSFSITRIKYEGGGDWYSDPSSLPNLLSFISNNTNIVVNPIENRMQISDDQFYRSNYLYITGHGNIKFSDKEAQILRDQILAGAFMHADDNFGMDKSFRREIKKVFPEKDLI